MLLFWNIQSKSIASTETFLISTFLFRLVIKSSSSISKSFDMIEAFIWFLPWLTEAWLWENSVKIAIVSTVIFAKPRNWCADYDSQGYDTLFYCL